MKKHLITVAAAFTALSLPAICTASPARPGGYVSGFIGASITRDTDATTVDYVVPKNFNDRIQFDPGITVGGTGGYDFGFLRLEGELSYKHAELKAIDDKSSGSRYRSIDGSLGALAMMGNVFFDLHNNSRVTPYWGAGAGLAVLNLSDTFGTNTTTGSRDFIYSGANDTVFAYQAGGGVEIALNRQLSLDLGYRYFGTSTATFDKDVTRTTELKLESHNVAVGLRVKF
ncbi:outer membrane protein [Geobacter argillaceus]|uniref:Opacity protein-like surface antigen n=1 Tax=Geobacter argillaceus TaxID=345631 RepID=A0A562W8H3_9BACT|nr:outer membrane beta-barrel protein [Geobacter argillaceus]TWJ26425.1 opacity protein-like surface antigen [Geobacter argillaceus]